MQQAALHQSSRFPGSTLTSSYCPCGVSHVFHVGFLSILWFFSHLPRWHVQQRWTNTKKWPNKTVGVLQDYSIMFLQITVQHITGTSKYKSSLDIFKINKKMEKEGVIYFW